MTKLYRASHVLLFIIYIELKGNRRKLKVIIFIVVKNSDNDRHKKYCELDSLPTGLTNNNIIS